MRKVWIYALCEQSKLPRYIGKSLDPYKRLKQHLKDRSSVRKARWIQSILANNEAPLLVLLEEVDECNWQKAERRWISRFRKRNIDICNHTDGGDGVVNPTDDSRKKLSEYRKNLWITDREKQLSILRSEKRRAAISKALSGRQSPWAKNLPQNQRKFHGPLKPEWIKKPRGCAIPGRVELLRERNRGNKYTLGRKIPQEELERRSKSLTGIKRSDKTRKKMSEAAKARWSKLKQQQNIG